ncbi:phage head spike fiber domain-containing protein [Oleomonas cavernae]|nr:hypothetical protein [Oleomonas cavernae]
MTIPAPGLTLEFVHAGMLDPRLTFSRASIATCIGQDGLLRTAQVNEPRIAYDPVTRERRGLQIEGSRTNLALRSEEIDNAAWIKSAASVTANAVAGPFGTVTADKLVEAASSVRHYAAQSIAYTTGQDYCWGARLLKGERTRARIRLPSSQFAANCFVDVDLSTGAVTATGGGAVRGGILPAVNGFFYAYVVGTATATASGNAEVEMLDALGASAYAGDGTSGLYLGGAQCEIGAYPSSYIPTTAATVTRAVDTVSFPFTGISFNALAGAFLAEWSADHAYPTQSGVTQTYYIATLSDGSSSNTVNLRVDAGGTPRARVTTAGVAQAQLSGAVLSAGAVARCATAWVKDSVAAVYTPATVVSDTAADMPTGVNKLTIGQSEAAGATSYLDGYLRRLKYWPARIADAELQSLAA